VEVAGHQKRDLGLSMTSRYAGKRLCSVLGCGTVTTRLNGLCHLHNNLRVRNGHETQRPIGLPRIRHYADKVAGFITGGDISALVAAIETVKRQGPMIS
jgi:hypothetical protein